MPSHRKECICCGRTRAPRYHSVTAATGLKKYSFLCPYFSSPTSSHACDGCFKRLQAWSKLSPLKQQEPIVKPSLIPRAGNGLFATRAYEKGEIVASFDGKQLTSLEHTRSTHYCVQIDEKFTLDCRVNFKQSLGRYINAPRTSRFKANCVLIVDQGNKRAYARTSTELTAGTEFLLAYGAGYWRATSKQARIDQRRRYKRNRSNPWLN